MNFRVSLYSIGICFLISACNQEPIAQRARVTLPQLPDTSGQGKIIYEDECQKCHAIIPGHNSKGPQLDRIYGAKAASLTDYNKRYSNALKNSGLIWDKNTLNKYMESPKTALPHGKMLYDGLNNEKDREAVIAYLSTLRQPDIPVTK